MKNAYEFTRPILADLQPDKNCRFCLGTGVEWVMTTTLLPVDKFRIARACPCVRKTIEGQIDKPSG